MSQRQRTGRPTNPENNTEQDDTNTLSDVRTLADKLMANAERSLQSLGLNDADDFLNATRQSGGQ